jgi:hypothetical protein
MCKQSIDISIKQPKNGDIIYTRTINISGISKGLKESTIVEVYVRTNDDYKQGETKIQYDGSWSFGPVYIGEETVNDLTASLYVIAENGIRSNLITITRKR